MDKAQFELKVKEALLQIGPKDSCRQPRIIVALSGGADSVALLLVLQALGYRPEAAHCNFRLRGSDSDADEAFVQSLCTEHRVKLHLRKFNTSEYAAKQKVSIEMAARQLRYRFFAALRNNSPDCYVAVGHHANDNAETLLLNLSMGTGIRGLCGMPHRRADGIIRPLLDLSRIEIENYLQADNQPYCTDRTNTDCRFKRNLIRHKILPALTELNPAALDVITRTMENLSGVSALFEDYLRELSERIITPKGLLTKPILASSSPETLCFELLRHYGFNRHQTIDIAAALHHRPGAAFYSNTHRLIVSSSLIELQPLLPVQSERPILSVNGESGKICLPCRKTIYWQTLSETDDHRSEICLPPTQAAFDTERLGRLTLRSPREGDRIKPYGLTGTKKVSRLFIDKKTPRIEREEFYLLCSDDAPIWIPGIAADSRHSITEQTRCSVRFYLTTESNEPTKNP